MQPPDDFLLSLYRSAREQPPERFRESLLDRVQARFGFSSAFWCDARVAGPMTLVPTSLRVRNVDPAFLADWTRLHPLDPAVPMALSNPGHAFRVHVPSLYKPAPDLADLLRSYEIQSMTVLLAPGPQAPAVQAICLYRREADAFCADADLRWLEAAMPHLGEAQRINAAIHSPADALDADGCCVAVADATNGGLLRADSGFLELLGREWSGFDGRRLPIPVARRWQSAPSFAHFGRRVRIEGRRSDGLVYLTARVVTKGEALTARQWEVALLYADGLSSKQVAQRCGLTPATVRSHLATVYDILGVHGKIEMAHRLRRLLDASETVPPGLPALR